MCDDNDDMPSLCPENELNHRNEYNSNSSSDDEDDNWMEVNDELSTERIKCLFCQQTFKISDTNAATIEHMTGEHDFNLKEILLKFSMDQYSFIKMINYIQTHHPEPAVIRQLSSAEIWKDEKYLKPIQYDDPWLMFDIEDIIQDDTSNNQLAEGQQLQQLLVQLKEKDELLLAASRDIEKLKLSFRTMFEKQTDGLLVAKNATAKPNCVSSVSVTDDEGYFNTYAHYGIHHDMLSDKVRTNSYRDAILQNSSVIKGKIVMDLGCGTSILSMFASQAGANKVISVDQSDIIYQAMDIVRKNNFTNITFVKGRLEDTELPVDKVDIIISEWMGYFLLFEGMLDSVIYARDHHLADGGILFPNRCNISLVGLGDESRHSEIITFWNDVYGFDMSCLQKEVLREAVVEVVDEKFLLTHPTVIADFDLMTVDVNCPNFTFAFSLSVKAAGKLTAFVGYFDTFFELPNKVAFSTGPHVTPTHWKQVIFYLRTPVQVQCGEVISGKFICKRDRKDVRSLFIEIEAFDKTFKYNLN